jgi:YhcN/YlaJ family sporulation lipoprotein
MKRIGVLALAYLVVFSLVGCNLHRWDGATNSDDNSTAKNMMNENNEQHREVTDQYTTKTDDHTRFEAADEAADQLVKLDEVEQASVIVANQNAYVAVVLKDDPEGEVSDDLERKIADQVKAADEGIEQVFVSSNPDFVGRMADYRDKLGEGLPVTGLAEEFNQMVQRVF